MLMAIKKSHNPKKQKTIQITKTQILLQRNKRLHVIIALLAVAVIAMAGYAGLRLMKVNTNKARLSEIIAIYDSMNLGESYQPISYNIFGDKRVYEYDKGRTFASEVEFGHNATPADTRVDLRKKVEAAGFTFVQTEYEGSIQPIDEFKNSKGNYVRIGVMSRSARDAIYYSNADGEGPFIDTSDQSPAHISIKVNLDDNNE